MSPKSTMYSHYFVGVVWLAISTARMSNRTSKYTHLLTQNNANKIMKVHCFRNKKLCSHFNRQNITSWAMSIWKMRGTYSSGGRVCWSRVLSTADWSTLRQWSGMLTINGPRCLDLPADCCNCSANLFTFSVLPTPARWDFITLTQQLTHRQTVRTNVTYLLHV